MSDAAAARARARVIAPRELTLAPSPRTPRHWAKDPFSTALMTALSITFPPGERFFIASVKGVLERVRDPQLLAQVRGFLAQEALHGREHAAFNAWLATRGIDVADFAADFEQRMARQSQLMTPRMRLGVTCAVEHFTAILAAHWLGNPTFLHDVHEDVRALWVWHSIEELDHKSVAFDVYEQVGGSYPLRVLTMLLATLGLALALVTLVPRLMARAGELGNVRAWLLGLWRYFGPRGFYTRLVPAYLRYFSPRFHPWKTDDRGLIERFEAEYGGAMPRGATRARTPPPLGDHASSAT